MSLTIGFVGRRSGLAVEAAFAIWLPAWLLCDPLVQPLIPALLSAALGVWKCELWGAGAGGAEGRAAGRARPAERGGSVAWQLSLSLLERLGAPCPRSRPALKIQSECSLNSPLGP